MGMYVYFRLSKMSKSESLCKVFVYGTLKRGNHLNGQWMKKLYAGLDIFM